MKSLLAFLLFLCVVVPWCGANEKPNVLFIAIDDLNDYISPLDNHPGIHTPNFERLAKRSVTLANAHCAAPACHPSRVAVMTGVHPTTSGIYRNAFRAHGPRWRHESPVLEDAVVLSQHFRNHGYRAVGGGKIFHTLQWTPGDSQNDPDAWDDYRGDPLDPISADWPRPELIPDAEAGLTPGRPLSQQHFGAAPLDPGHRYGDELVTDWAIEQLKESGDEPLFLAVGLFRPHIPFEVPQKWFDLHPVDEVQLPPYRADDLNDAHEHERVSWHKWVTENDQWKHLMRGYLASISYVDNELGRLLDALDASPMADNTIIVLWTDHGFHIGEKDNWEKFALWDQTTRVPCFIHAPGVSTDGVKTRIPVSLVDLYPTLCELAGLPVPEQCDGDSLVPLLKNPGDAAERFAISSYQFRGEKTPSHAVIDERYRLIRNGNGFEELYDLNDDPNEFTNRIDDAELEGVREKLRAQLPGNPADQVGPANESPHNLSRHSTIKRVKQEIANRPFEISFKVRKNPKAAGGVLVSNGGEINGYAVYVKDGVPVFAVRRRGTLYLAEATAAENAKGYIVSATLSSDGAMLLMIDGKVVARGNAGGLIPANPNEGFTLGSDPESKVGEYETDSPFEGEILDFKIFAAKAVAAKEPSSASKRNGAVRVLFLGHAGGGPGQASHQPARMYPHLAKALGREAIYFDYVDTPEAAFGDRDKLFRYDAVLLYANHKTLDRKLWKNLKDFVEAGGGFIPVHCASWCFQNILEYDQLVGGRFRSHKTGVFSPKTLDPNHPAIAGVPTLEAWDETYYHNNHNEAGRTVLQVREGPDGDPQPGPEPWTWVRTQGKGRVFYTASGHDDRVWAKPEFHALMKSGILWAAGDNRKAEYETFLSHRAPLRYEPRDNIANYEKRPKPLDYQFPLPAEDSLDYLQAPVGWNVELFASEPQIVNPIFLSWDERGRLWVAETVDYPNEVRPEGGNDTIKILEDTDGNGRADQVTVFAEGLNIPTSLTHWNGGVIVAQAPDFLFLKDTDGDGKADLRETIMTGWGIQDTHAGPSNLRYGLDNWIYGTVGYSGFAGAVGGHEMKFGSGVFRFRPDGSAMEFLHQFNNNTWGLGLNAAGDVFGSTANRNPAFFGGFPETGYPEDEKGQSARMIADEIVFHPITPNVRQVDAFGQYTAGAGYAFATSKQFPPEWRDRIAFIGGPTGHLLGMFENVREGAGYRAINRFHLLASADEWFSPVAAEVGPDGHLWVADWYNFIIQHNPTPTPERGGYAAERGSGNAHENPLRDKQHGRIYRAVWEDAEVTSLSSLENASDDELVAVLSHDNQFWRLTAQRILVAGKRTDVVPLLKAQIADSGGVGAAHALWTLEGLGSLDRDTHQLALLKPNDPTLKRNAIRAIPNTDEGMQLFFDTAVIQDDDSLVRLAAFAKMAHFPDRVRVEQAAKQLMREEENQSDEWLAIALRASGAGKVTRGPATITGPNLLPNSSFEEVVDGLPAHWAVRTYSGEAEHVSGTGQARTGKRSLRISSDKGADSSLFAKITVKPNTDYRISGWVKTAGLLGARGAQMNAHEVQQQPRGSRTNAFQRATREWSKVEVIFNSLDRTQLTINCLFGGWGKSTGTAWWDDVALHEVEYEIEVEEKPELMKGDAQRGKTIFETHPVAACNRCHVVEGKGGPIGPALDGIASRKEEDYILQSLTDPQAVMAGGFPAEISPMPPMGVLLTEQELRDVMAYLLTLKE